MNPENDILTSAKELVHDALTKEPGLSGHSDKMLTAVAYFMRASSLGRHLSMYDVEEMFGVGDTPFRKCHKKMAGIVKVNSTPFVRERSRNAYDIYAEILKNEGSLLNTLIRNVHVSYGEVVKHITFLVDHGLIREVKDGISKGYFPTDKGRQYLELYGKLRALTSGNTD